jgi:copper chaperone NosL
MRHRINKAIHTFLALGVMLAFIPPLLLGADRGPSKPSAKDRCPVCGMFVAKYPDFAAQITFKDGSVVFFDGAKDMFKYYLDPAKYVPGRKMGDIGSIYVTDYYALRYFDGLKAYYVLGSDIYGPMGRELIPFEREKEAREFMRDHKGVALLMFRDISGSTIKGLD